MSDMFCAFDQKRGARARARARARESASARVRESVKTRTRARGRAWVQESVRAGAGAPRATVKVRAKDIHTLAREGENKVARVETKERAQSNREERQCVLAVRVARDRDRWRESARAQESEHTKQEHLCVCHRSPCWRSLGAAVQTRALFWNF